MKNITLEKGIDTEEIFKLSEKEFFSLFYFVIIDNHQTTSWYVDVGNNLCIHTCEYEEPEDETWIYYPLLED